MANSIFSPDELAHAEWSAAPVIVSISGTTAKSAQLAEGTYYAISDTACFFKQGSTAITAATTDNYMPANLPFVVKVRDTTAMGFIAAITSSATGKFYIMRPV